MKKLSMLFVMMLFTAAVAFSQNAPKHIVEKCTKMKDLIKTDLGLSDTEADGYYKIILEKFTKDAAEIKKLETPEAKKEYHAASNKEFTKSLQGLFAKDRAAAIKKWTAENQSKFNKSPKKEKSEGGE